MARLLVTTREGDTRGIESDGGVSVMEVIRGGGLDELQALCGGGCSCATCHVYVSPDWAGALPPVGADEDDLLDSSPHRTAVSRLSCQIAFSEALDGLAVTIAPED